VVKVRIDKVSIELNMRLPKSESSECSGQHEKETQAKNFARDLSTFIGQCFCTRAFEQGTSLSRLYQTFKKFVTVLREELHTYENGKDDGGRKQ
jgi:hypothetical protein